MWKAVQDPRATCSGSSCSQAPGDGRAGGWLSAWAGRVPQAVTLLGAGWGLGWGEQLCILHLQQVLRMVWGEGPGPSQDAGDCSLSLVMPPFSNGHGAVGFKFTLKLVQLKKKKKFTYKALLQINNKRSGDPVKQGEGILMTNGLKQQVTSSSAPGNAD